MSTLSFEVLTLIFKLLESKDLVQCQLVSKSWNQSSLKLLYSEIIINTEKKSCNFVRTIKGSPHLGQYLEDIKFGGLFKKKKHSDIWDKHHLLHTIIKHCPNVLKLNCGMACSAFWTRLILAATQGDLPRLQYIACPNMDNFDSYVYTLLAFKQFLTRAEISVIEDDDLPDLIDTESYPMLLDNLNQFPYLETLTMHYMSGHKMTSYDAVFNGCKSLKNVSIMTESGGEEFPYEDTVIDAQSIHPCHNINTLRCEWDTLMSDNQMNYTMQKFPNLKSLSVTCKGFSYQYYDPGSVHILTKFLDFATNLQECDIEMFMEEEKALDIWGSIISEKYNTPIVSMSMSSANDFDNPVALVKFKQTEITLECQPSEISESRYIKFLSTIGKNVRSLSLGMDLVYHYNYYELFTSLEKIARAIQVCPLLEKLELCRLVTVDFPNNITYQNSGIRSLKLTSCNYWTCVEILKNMSFVFPNLKEVVIFDDNIKFNESFVKDIIMPNSSLDSLRWQFFMFDFRKNDMIEEFFVRLEMDSIERFFIAFKGNLSPITREQYNHSRVNQIYMNISCRKLNKIIINRFTYAI